MRMSRRTAIYAQGGKFNANSFTYTGTYQWVDDGNDNWRIKFLTSGTFTPKKRVDIDAFLVGGGASGAAGSNGYGGNGAYSIVATAQLLANTSYPIVIGAGGAGGNGGRTAGGNTTAFSQTGTKASTSSGSYAVYGSIDNDYNGADGPYEFLETASGVRYAGGGGRGSYTDSAGVRATRFTSGGDRGGGDGGNSGSATGSASAGESGLANTGAGGGGGSVNDSTGTSGGSGSGGSGIVIIRNSRAA